MHSLSAEAPPQCLTCYSESMNDSGNTEMCSLCVRNYVLLCPLLEISLCFLHCLNTTVCPFQKILLISSRNMLSSSQEPSVKGIFGSHSVLFMWPGCSVLFCCSLWHVETKFLCRNTDFFCFQSHDSKSIHNVLWVGEERLWPTLWAML